MSHQSELIATNIDEYLDQHERKELLRLLTCGSVDDGKSTLIGRLLYDAKMIYEEGFPFEHYNRCNDARRLEAAAEHERKMEELEILDSDLPGSVVTALTTLTNRGISDDACRFDAYMVLTATDLGTAEDRMNQAILNAVECTEALNAAFDAKEAAQAHSLHENRCCSKNFKDCAKDSDYASGSVPSNFYECELDHQDKWLKTGPPQNCQALDASCENEKCCPGTTCDTGLAAPVCVKNGDGRRRSLMEEAFVRPDIAPEGEREIHVLGTLGALM